MLENIASKNPNAEDNSKKLIQEYQKLNEKCDIVLSKIKDRKAKRKKAG